VIAPDGSMDSRGRRFWNAGPSCCNFDHRNIDDIARIDRLIDRWTARPGVDPKRVYVLGYSNGGFMAHRLACRLSSRIAAVASAAGAAPAPNEECTVNSKIGVLEVHGDADTVVKYEGGTVFRDANLAPHLSAAETLKSWSTRLGCSGKVKTGQSLDLDPRLPSLETRVEHFSDCAHGSVALWTVHGGTHYIGSTPQALEEAWKFFEAHSK
jgi:polyhydroxybutyrate depolymerase